MGEPVERLEIGSLRSVVDAAHRTAEQTPAASLRAAKRRIVPRELPLSLQGWTDPDTGEERSCEVVSRVMDGPTRARVALVCAGLVQHAPWHSVPPVEQARAFALARCGLQLREIPDWLDKAVSEDDFVLFALEERLLAHERWFRLGHDGTGGPHPKSFRLVAPALDDLEPASASGGPV